ncbi:MAG: octanoyltransferase [Solibacterales bacterium]|mgnify:FL=1|nr:octanoyltransferase [Bryobacterales bacterium]|tara:strand:+ start:9145 stop:9849 length:705 start_codon:yes stop_codon:yes gene_type:complete
MITPSTSPQNSSILQGESNKPPCEYRDLGRVCYRSAFELQQDLVAQRKEGAIPDQLLLVEHTSVITLGRNAHSHNVLLPAADLARCGIEVHASDRGGDVTYHGPGQIVGYPILDLRYWKRDVVKYLRALEQVMIESVKPLGVRAERLNGCTGCWVDGAKLGAIGVHISRWVTSHGFALNLSPELKHFDYIVPCGIDKPVTSVAQLTGKAPDFEKVKMLLVDSFGEIFGRLMVAS